MTWNTTPAAIRILCAMTCDTPALVEGLPHIITGDPVYEYDRDDIRVRELVGFHAGWMGCMDDQCLRAQGPGVDQAITEYLAAWKAENEAHDRKWDLLKAGHTLGEVEAIMAGRDDLPESRSLAA